MAMCSGFHIYGRESCDVGSHFIPAMVPLDTVHVRLYDPFMRRAFDMGGSSKSTSTTDPGYDSSSTSAQHAFAARTSSCAAAASAATAASARSLELQDADVVGGRSPMTHAHPGNRLYNNLVKSHTRQYKGTTRREEKSRITNMVISHIESKGGRFLVEENGTYYEMDRKGIHEKVSHALRSKKEPVAVRIRKPRRRTEQQPPSGEEQDEFDKLLQKQRSIYDDLVRRRESAGAYCDEFDDDDDGDEEEEQGPHGYDAFP